MHFESDHLHARGRCMHRGGRRGRNRALIATSCLGAVCRLHLCSSNTCDSRGSGRALSPPPKCTRPAAKRTNPTPPPRAPGPSGTAPRPTPIFDIGGVHGRHRPPADPGVSRCCSRMVLLRLVGAPICMTNANVLAPRHWRARICRMVRVFKQKKRRRMPYLTSCRRT